MGLLPGYKKCFFCGPATGGLSLHIQYADGTAFCDFIAHEKFQGYDGMLHGGIVTGILDEVMWWTLFMETKTVCATWKIEAEFKRPIKCGEAYRASGQLVRSAHGTYYVAGLIEDASKQQCALGNASFRKIRKFTIKDIVEYLDFRGVPPEVRSLFETTGISY